MIYRDEFKRHKDAAPKFVPLFMREWQQYEQFMSQKQDSVRYPDSFMCCCITRTDWVLLWMLLSQFGKELSAEEKALLDGEQQEKLRSLKDAARKVGESITR